jgi:hypothetical protein
VGDFQHYNVKKTAVDEMMAIPAVYWTNNLKLDNISIYYL